MMTKIEQYKQLQKMQKYTDEFINKLLVMENRQPLTLEGSLKISWIGVFIEQQLNFMNQMWAIYNNK